MFEIRPRLRLLLAGDTEAFAGWLREPDWRWPVVCAVTICLGGGVYGATLGLWRNGWQAVFTAIKFPLLVFLTCGANAALNGCLGLLLGSGLGIRQTKLAILMSFAVTAMVLAACAPLMLFLLWNTPSLEARDAVVGHSLILVAHVAVIALAGLAGARRLFRLLVKTSGGLAGARRVFFGWLAGNLLLGAQLAWVLRPFVGSPALAVQFLRADALHGNFFQAVWSALRHLI